MKLWIKGASVSIDQAEVNVGMRFPDLVNPSGDISILIGRLHLVGRQRNAHGSK